MTIHKKELIRMATSMTFEQLEHFLRHLHLHAQEIRAGTFNKDLRSYIMNVTTARDLSNEVAHTLVHLMRLKEFEGYEEADYEFDTAMPNKVELKSYRFSKFAPGDFTYGITIANTIRMGLVSDQNISLPIQESQEQLQRFGKAIKDCNAMIAILNILSQKKKLETQIQTLKNSVQKLDGLPAREDVIDSLDTLTAQLKKMSLQSSIKAFG